MTYVYCSQVEVADQGAERPITSTPAPVVAHVTAGTSDSQAAGPSSVETAGRSASARPAAREETTPSRETLSRGGPVTPPPVVTGFPAETPAREAAATRRLQDVTGSGTEPDPDRSARRARPRMGAAAAAPFPLYGDVVKCLKEIGEIVKGVDDPDQLFCNSVAGELRRRQSEENRKIKAEICRILYG